MGCLRLLARSNHEEKLLGVVKESINQIRVTVVHAL
jgi:hypothetical protein